MNINKGEKKQIPLSSPVKNETKPYASTWYVRNKGTELYPVVAT